MRRCACGCDRIVVGSLKRTLHPVCRWQRRTHRKVEREPKIVDITPDQIEECYRKALQWIRWERSQGWR